MGHPANQGLLDFCRFVVETKKEEEVLFTLNNYSKRRLKLLFLRNCIWLIKEYSGHLLDFESNCSEMKKSLRNFKRKHTGFVPEDLTQQLTKTEDFTSEQISQFVLNYVLFNERILETRKDLEKFVILQNQTGQQFDYKGIQKKKQILITFR